MIKTVEQLIAKIDKTYPKNVQAVAKAYADCLSCGRELDYKITNNVRNLDFQGEYTDADTFIKQADVVGSYNFFSANLARDIVMALPASTKFRLARAGSVAVYIKTTRANAMRVKDIADADEQTYAKGELRLWWD